MPLGVFLFVCLFFACKWKCFSILWNCFGLNILLCGLFTYTKHGSYLKKHKIRSHFSLSEDVFISERMLKLRFLLWEGAKFST
jgi:hypothetical protein